MLKHHYRQHPGRFTSLPSCKSLSFPSSFPMRFRPSPPPSPCSHQSLMVQSREEERRRELREERRNLEEDKEEVRVDG